MSICLSCFRIVIDFLLFSLIFFFFQCFSITTLNVIIRSAFDLFWLPYYITFSQLVYFIFTVGKFGFREIFALWITLISRSWVSQDTISLWTTSSAPMPHGQINDASENPYKNRNNKEVFVTMAQELGLYVIRCCGLIFAFVQSSPSPILSEGSEEWGGGGRLYTGYLILTFRWASQYSLSLAKVVNLRIFIYTWRASNEGLFLKVDFKALAKNNPMSDCWQCQNHRT